VEDGMVNPNLIEEISSKLQALVGQSPVADIEKNVRAVLQGAFAKLDLVTREEFEVQAEVLARTRAKLEQLEAKLDALERAQGERREA
jgi:ubiquinone biosynthesis accessory factor UbiK